MKKRLRAEVYASYVRMGQAGYKVDPQVYEIVRSRRADPSLCGRFACASEALPSPNMRTLKRSRRRAQEMAFPINDNTVEEIVGEELPSTRVWHRYLVRWRGYEPDCEAWRLPGRGSIGDPVESWELASSLQGTEALARWEARATQ